MTGQDEREVLTVEQARVLLRRAWRCTCWSGNREECAKPVEQVERFLAGFHLTPTAEVKAEELAQIIEPLLAAHGTKSRNSYYVRCRCGYIQGGAEGSHPTLHEHKAQVIAKDIATHLRENGGA